MVTRKQGISAQRGAYVLQGHPRLDRDRDTVYDSRPGAGTCNAPHPRVRERVKGVVRFLTCERPVGHKVQHGGNWKGTYRRWS